VQQVYATPKCNKQNPYQALQKVHVDKLLDRLRRVSNTLTLSDFLEDAAIAELCNSLILALVNHDTPVRLAKRICKDRSTTGSEPVLNRSPTSTLPVSNHSTTSTLPVLNRFATSSIPVNHPTSEQLLQTARKRRKLRYQKRSYPGSKKLDPFHHEIISLWKAGGSVRDITNCLRIDYRCKVNSSTVHRYLRQIKFLTLKS